MTSRRQFLQTITTAGSLLLPKSLFTKSPDHSLHFIHLDALNSWSVADPVEWALENAHKPILERASERLRKLTPNDSDRIIRLVIRRCRLNLIEIHPRRSWSTIGESIVPMSDRSSRHMSWLDRRSRSYCGIGRRKSSQLSTATSFFTGARLPLNSICSFSRASGYAGS